MKFFLFIILCFLMFCAGTATAQKKNKKKIVKYNKEEYEFQSWIAYSREINSYRRHDNRVNKVITMGMKNGFYSLESIILWDSLVRHPSQIIGLNINYGDHLSDEDQVSFFEENALKYKNLRYLVMEDTNGCPDIVFKLKNLRALSLVSCCDEIHKDVGNLQNLRYFYWSGDWKEYGNDMSKYPNVEIPNSFYSLSKLTMLYLYAGGKINMPKDFLKRMPNIKTLVVE